MDLSSDIQIDEIKMEQQNITLSVSKDLLQRARLIAAKRNISLSELIDEYFENMNAEEEGYQRAQAFCLDRIKDGYEIDAKPGLLTRSELHERR
jgi:hypothetical protein